MRVACEGEKKRLGVTSGSEKCLSAASLYMCEGSLFLFFFRELRDARNGMRGEWYGMGLAERRESVCIYIWKDFDIFIAGSFFRGYEAVCMEVSVMDREPAFRI